MVRAGYPYLAGVVVAIGCGGAASDARETLGSVAQAELLSPLRPNVGIDFVGGGPNGTPQPLAATEIAGAVPYKHWRSETGASGFDFTVNTSDGMFAQIEVLWSSAETFSTAIADNGGNSRMMKGYLNTTNTSETTVTIRGLPTPLGPYSGTYATADIYVYFDGSNLSADRTGVYTLDTGLGVTTLSGKDKAGVQFSGAFVPVTVSGATGNFIKFSRVAIGPSEITLRAVPGVSTDASKRAPINAVQIIPDADGGDPKASLVQAANGSFYGVNAQGGAYGNGTVFSITSTGAFNLLHTFVGDAPDPFGFPVAPEGMGPSTRLDLGPDGNFYGTTLRGGSADQGVVFKMTPAGVLTVLHHMDESASERLVVGGDGALYGTTPRTIYRVTRDGASFTTLHTLAADGSEGGSAVGVKFLSTDGNFYGVTQFGGPADRGVVFRMTPSGAYTVVHGLTVAGGSSHPRGKLTLGADGKLYGTTDGDFGGTVFSVTPSGTFKRLFTFQDATNHGVSPRGEILRASDDTLYGVTREGGANGAGTVYKITNGVVTPRWFSFPPGFFPEAGLIQGADGNLYGTAFGNGQQFGLVYKLTTSGAITVLRTF